MAAHRYWRLKIYSNWGGNQVGIGDVEMRTASGGTNLSITGNGTAFGDGTPAFAFDGIVDGSNNWFSASSPVYPQYIGWDFGSGNAEEINHLTLKNSVASTTLMINSVALEYSDDSTNWTAWMFVQNPQGSSLVTAFQWQPFPSGEAELTLPMPVVEGGFGAAAFITLGASVSGNFGVIADITLPMLRLGAQFGGSADIKLPMLQLYATGKPLQPNAFAATLRMSVEGRFGAFADLKLPMLTVSGEGTVVGIGRAALALPAPVVSGHILGGAVATGDIVLPALRGEGRFGGFGGVVLPGVAVSGSFTGGTVGRAALTLPMLLVSGKGSAQNYGHADIVLPMLQMVPNGQAHIVLPLPVVSGVIEAVIEVTFEAYAVNLKAAYKGVRYYPVTRFTQFPFLKVVRWKDAYYGIAADGLYRIEGDTDHAAPDPLPIPWRMETGTTDFGTREKKRAPQLYVGGRMGPSAKAKVIAGEKREFEYDGSTPRGQTAQNYRIKFGKGLNERFYAFGLSDEDGGDLQLNTLDIDIAQSERAI